jgi:TP901 family phage tail tape measure protein
MSQHDLSIIIRAAIDPNSKEQQQSLQRQINELAKNLKLNVSIDGKSVDNLSHSFHNLGEEVAKAQSKIKKFYVDSNLSSEGYKDLQKRVNEIKSSADEFAKVTVQTYKNTNNIKSAVIEYRNEMGQLVKEQLKWTQFYDKQNNTTKKVFQPVGYTFVDDIAKQQKASDELQSKLYASQKKFKEQQEKDVQSQQKAIQAESDRIYKVNEGQISRLKNNISQLENGLKGVKSSENVELIKKEYQSLITVFEELQRKNKGLNDQQQLWYQNELNRIKSLVKEKKALESKSPLDGVYTEADFNLDKQKISRSIQGGQSQYGRLFDDTSAKNLLSELNKLDHTAPNARQRIKEINEEVRQLKANASSAAHTFSNELIHNFEKMAMWSVAGGAYFGALRGVEGTIQNIADVERGMAGVAQVLPEVHNSQSELNRATLEFVGVAEKYGQSIEDVLNGAKLWGRQYKDLNTVLELVNTTTLLSVVDNLSLEEANKSLEATMVQYGMVIDQTASKAEQQAQAFEYSRKITDAWSNVAHNSMASAQDLAQGMERTGSVAKQMGVDFDSMNALIATSVRNTGLAGANLGNMWKTVLGSIHSDKAVEELDAIGVKMQQVGKDGTQSWTPVKSVLEQMMIMTAGTNKSMEEVEKAASGGKYQWAKLAASISDLSTYYSALEQSIMGTGSTMAYAGIQLETLSKKYEILKEHLMGLSVATGQGGLSTFLKDIVDWTTNLISGFEKMDASTIEWTLGLSALAVGLGKLIPILNAVKVAEEGVAVATATADALTGRWANLVAGALVAGLGVYAFSAGKAAEEQRKLNDAIEEASKTAPQIADQYKRRAGEIDDVIKNIKLLQEQLNSPEALNNPARKKALEEDYQAALRFLKNIAGVEFTPRINKVQTVKEFSDLGEEIKKNLNQKAFQASVKVEQGQGLDVTVDNLTEKYVQLKQALQDTSIAEQDKAKIQLELHNTTSELLKLVPSLSDGFNNNGEAVTKLDKAIGDTSGTIENYNQIVRDAMKLDLAGRIDEQQKKVDEANKKLVSLKNELRMKVNFGGNQFLEDGTPNLPVNPEDIKKLNEEIETQNREYLKQTDLLNVLKGQQKDMISANEEQSKSFDGAADSAKALNSSVESNLSLSKRQVSDLRLFNKALTELTSDGKVSQNTLATLMKSHGDYATVVDKGTEAQKEFLRTLKDNAIKELKAEQDKTDNLIKQVEVRITALSNEKDVREKLARTIRDLSSNQEMTPEEKARRRASVTNENQLELKERLAQLEGLKNHKSEIDKTINDLMVDPEKTKKAANEAAQAYKNEEDHLQKLYEIKMKNNEADIANTEYLMSQAKKGSQEKIALIQKEIDLKQQRIKLLEEEKKREAEVAKNTPAPDISSSVSVSGNSNASKIWSFLSSKGLNAHAVAGIMGNLQQENSLNTDDNSGGLGLAQWLGERRQGVIEYAKQIGADYQSLEAQLGYLWKEISSGSQGVTVDKLNSMSASDGAKYFSDKFERPNANYAMNNKRMQYANEFYNQYSGSNVDGISKSMNTYVKVADEAALKTADFDSQIAKLREEILKLSWDKITESLDGYEEANKKLDQDIEGSKSHLFQYNEASKEYRDELSKEIPILKQKQDNLHLEAESIRATLKANEEADEQHKLTAVQVDELNQKLQQLGISWWNLQGDIKSVNDQLEKSKLDEVVQNTIDKIDEFQNKVNELKDTLDLLPNGSYKDRDNIMVQLYGDYQNQINIYKNSISQLEELNNSLDKNSDAYRNNQKQILSYQSTIRGLYKDEKQLKDELNNQIADKLSTLKQDALDFMKQQHDKQEQGLQDNIDAVTKSYDNQIDAQEKKLKLLDDEIDKEERIKKLNEINKELSNAINDKRTEYITSDGRKILSFDHEKVSELQKQRDELLQQYQRDDIKKAVQDEVDRLKKAKDDQVEILKRQLDNVKTQNQQEEEEVSRHWDRLIEGAKNGTLTQSQIMDSWFTGQVSAMGNFRGEVTNLVDQIKQAFLSLAQIQIPNLRLPQLPTPPSGGGGGTWTDQNGNTHDDSDTDNYNNTRDNPDADRGNSYNDGAGSSGNIEPPSFDTGGFTGSGFSDGKLAILHQKELVLNQMDTSNILKAVNLVRNFASNIQLPNFASVFESITPKSPTTVDQSKTIHINNPTIKADNPMELFKGIEFLITSHQG